MIGDLVTWDKIKTILNFQDDDQERIEYLITAVSKQAEKIADRILAARDVSIKLDSHGGRELILPSYPVNEVYRINLDTSGIFSIENDLKENEYSIKDGILRLHNRMFPMGYNVILFEGNIGYIDIPEDLQLAVIEYISASYKMLQGQGGQVGVKSLQADGAISSSYEIDIPFTIRKIFLNYRNVRI